ncbi:CYFA0S01e13124g1_1 [Cyberlindnera fabianii]|uniref:CYFA0S01e13124g1_1 n=1 Tax=Cyberlindnera fabianii TaxID=36022 RepID=A0A061AJ87_CYBFA|nr:CYFA0S01e13124g1_1 [Cyberlindnera fabianii]
MLGRVVSRVLRSQARSVPFYFSSTTHTQLLYFSSNTEPISSSSPQHHPATLQHQPTASQQPYRNKKREKQRLRKLSKRKTDSTASDGILQHEIQQLAHDLGITSYTNSAETIQAYRQRGHTRIIEDLKIIRISSTGSGLGVCVSETDPDARVIVVVPFTTVGDIIKVELGVHFEKYAEGHIVQVQMSSGLRRDDLVQCKHFTKCSGCQLQMMSYQDQLQFKTNVVKNAYAQFGFETETLPIGGTVGSPLQYGYRTKLTPHFNSDRKNIMLGFERAGLGKGLFNVDSCSIATDVLSNALTEDRDDLENIVRRYKKFGTVLLRDKSVDGKQEYTTNHTEIITQQINEFRFQFPAGEFFQNNKSILPVLLDHVREYIDPTKHRNIVDTYCGSGFFGISLSKSAEKLIGIEISKGSLAFAKQNADLNDVKNASFLLGSSEEIFKGLDSFNPEETIVILDPSRKGSNEDYLTQLSAFKPSLIVYVSCNVFSQARDLQFFCNQTENGQEYELKTIRGYDFFPQTKHVESLAILELRK